MKRGFLVVLFVGASQLIACDESPDFLVSTFDIHRTAWDSLSVRVSFEATTFFGSRFEVVPDSVQTAVFTEAYDTLYQGSDRTLVVADAELGDREMLIVEACALYRERTACEQRSVVASPKRIEPNTELVFPESDAFDRGSFELDYSLYRQVFGSEEWERIERRVRPETYLLAYVTDQPADAVKVPVRQTRNRFNLTRFAKYRDFRYQIKSHMMDSDTASVSFDLYARLGKEPERVASDRVVLRAKSEDERRTELHELVELAGSQILDRMKGFWGLRSAYVFINDWSYRALDKVYRAEIELHWQSGLRGEWYDMIGALTVRSNGSAAQFDWIQGSTTAARRWDSEMDSSTVFLGQLHPHAELRPPAEDVRF